MTPKKRSVSWRTKLLLVLTVFAVLPVALLAYWMLGELEETYRSSRLRLLEALATAKAGAIEQLTETRTRDVERIASLLAPRVSAMLDADSRAHTPEDTPSSELPALEDEQLREAPQPAQPGQGQVEPQQLAPGSDSETPREPPTPSTPAEEAREHSLATLRQNLGLILWDQAEFEELLVIDNEGRVLASTFAAHEGRSAADLEYFQGGRRATYVQPVFLSPITNQLTMVVSTPIRDANTMEEIGVLAARLNLQGLFSLINDTTGLGDTGETVVAKAIGEELVFMAPTRHDPEAVLSRRFSTETHTELPEVQAALGHSGADLRQDYRGKSVLAAWRPVPALRWGLVVKIDESEAMSTPAAVRLRTLQISCAILLMAILASILFSREFVRPLRQLKDAADRISRGDLGVRLAIQSSDEIGELADSFERMVAAIKFFREHARTAEEDVLEDELDAPPKDVARS